jgi:hypothetical protein
MIWRTTLANVVGCAAVACSCSFWIEFCVTKLVGHTPLWLNIGLVGWVLGLVLGIILAFTAAALGSRRWAFAAVLPLISFIAMIAAIFSSPIQW